jgi:hypothetical protein
LFIAKSISRLNFFVRYFLKTSIFRTDTNYRRLGAWEINKSITIPPNVKLKEYIPNLLKSDIFAELVNEHKIKLFIVGSAYDGGTYNENKIFEIYIIDAKSKTITKQLTVRWASTLGPGGLGADSSYDIRINSCSKVYKTILTKAKHEIENILERK